MQRLLHHLVHLLEGKPQVSLFENNRDCIKFDPFGLRGMMAGLEMATVTVVKQEMWAAGSEVRICWLLRRRRTHCLQLGRTRMDFYVPGTGQVHGKVLGLYESDNSVLAQSSVSFSLSLNFTIYDNYTWRTLTKRTTFYFVIAVWMLLALQGSCRHLFVLVTCCFPSCCL